jgi:Bacterial PH domain
LNPGYSAAHSFRPASREGATIGFVASGVALLLGLALLVRGAFGGIRFATFAQDVVGLALLVIAALAFFWAWSLYSLRYLVDDDALQIVWGLTRVAIPVAQIQRIVLGGRYGEPRINGLSWRGNHVGRGRVARIGEVLFYSAHLTPADLVYISTNETTFGVSVGDARGLARAVQAAQESSGETAAAAIASYRVLPGQDLLSDRSALLIAAGSLIAFLFAAGYIYSRFQALPLALPIDFPPTTGPERIGDRAELLRLPLTALIWLIIGIGLAAWAHARLRTVSYAVLAGTLFAECLYAIGALAAAH